MHMPRHSRYFVVLWYVPSLHLIILSCPVVSSCCSELVLDHRPEEDAAVDIILILYFSAPKTLLCRRTCRIILIQFSINRTGTRFGDPRFRSSDTVTDDKKIVRIPSRLRSGSFLDPEGDIQQQ